MITSFGHTIYTQVYRFIYKWHLVQARKRNRKRLQRMYQQQLENNRSKVHNRSLPQEELERMKRNLKLAIRMNILEKSLKILGFSLIACFIIYLYYFGVIESLFKEYPQFK